VSVDRDRFLAVRAGGDQVDTSSLQRQRDCCDFVLGDGDPLGREAQPLELRLDQVEQGVVVLAGRDGGVDADQGFVVPTRSKACFSFSSTAFLPSCKQSDAGIVP
jgi:hypothetical protein